MTFFIFSHIFHISHIAPLSCSLTPRFPGKNFWPTFLGFYFLPKHFTFHLSKIHTRMLFFTFLHLALCSRNNKYTTHAIYFFLIHHCTNRLSSLHIFVHHCTFCASLHTKTNPGLHLFHVRPITRKPENCPHRVDTVLSVSNVMYFICVVYGQH